MKEEIADLLLCLDSDDFQEKNCVISDIAILLEMNTYILYGGIIAPRMDEYKSLIPEELVSVRLSIDEQKEIIDELTKKVSIDETHAASMFLAIGKSYYTVGLPKLLEIIKCSWNKFNNEAAYQSIIALDNFIIYLASKNLNTKLLQIRKDVIDFLQTKSDSTDDRLAECAKRILEKLESIQA